MSLALWSLGGVEVERGVGGEMEESQLEVEAGLLGRAEWEVGSGLSDMDEMVLFAVWCFLCVEEMK